MREYIVENKVGDEIVDEGMTEITRTSPQWNFSRERTPMWDMERKGLRYDRYQRTYLSGRKCIYFGFSCSINRSSCTQTEVVFPSSWAPS